MPGWYKSLFGYFIPKYNTTGNPKFKEIIGKSDVKIKIPFTGKPIYPHKNLFQENSPGKATVSNQSIFHHAADPTD